MKKVTLDHGLRLRFDWWWRPNWKDHAGLDPEQIVQARFQTLEGSAGEPAEPDEDDEKDKDGKKKKKDKDKDKDDKKDGDKKEGEEKEGDGEEKKDDKKEKKK